MQPKSKTRVYYAAMLASIFLGTLFSPSFKLLLRMDVGLTSDNITFFRMVLTSAVLWAYCLCVPALRQELATVFRSRRLMGMLLLLGVLRGADLLSWAYALNGTGTFVLNILSNSSPVFILLFSYLLYGEKTSLPPLLGVGICVCGLLIVGLSSGTGGANPLGVILMTTSALCYTFFLLISRRMRTGSTQISAITIMTLVFTVCAACAYVPCAVAQASMGPFPRNAWLLLGVMVVCGTLISQIVPIWAVRFLKPASVSMLSLSGPIFSALTSFVLLGEVPSVQVLLGGAVVLSGLFVYVVMDERAKQQAPAEVSALCVQTQQHTRRRRKSA